MQNTKIHSGPQSVYQVPTKDLAELSLWEQSLLGDLAWFQGRVLLPMSG